MHCRWISRDAAELMSFDVTSVQRLYEDASWSGVRWLCRPVHRPAALNTTMTFLCHPSRSNPSAVSLNALPSDRIGCCCCRRWPMDRRITARRAVDSCREAFGCAFGSYPGRWPPPSLSVRSADRYRWHLHIAQYWSFAPFATTRPSVRSSVGLCVDVIGDLDAWSDGHVLLNGAARSCWVIPMSLLSTLEFSVCPADDSLHHTLSGVTYFVEHTFVV